MARAPSTIVLLTLLVHIKLASSLLCYSCSAPLDSSSDCVSLANQSPVPCGGYNVCIRYIISTYNNDVIYRGCRNVNACSQIDSQYENNPTVTVKECFTCSQDGCNGGNPNSESTVEGESSPSTSSVEGEDSSSTESPNSSNFTSYSLIAILIPLVNAQVIK